MTQLNFYVQNGLRLQGRSNAKLIGAADLVALVAKVGAPRVPSSFFVATARHESDLAVNEVDVELDDGHRGFTTKGLFQVSDGWGQRGAPTIAADDARPTENYVVGDDELARVGMKGEDLLDPEISVRAYSRLAEANFDRVLAAWRMTPAGQVATAYDPDLFAYLALGHNEGLAAVSKTIAFHGMRWGAAPGVRSYKGGNGACDVHCLPKAMAGGAAFNCAKCSEYIRHIGAYGDDCLP